MRDPISQKIHDAMISRLAEDLKQRGYENLRVDHLAEYAEARPESIYCQTAEAWLKPDLTAEKCRQTVLFEVETDDSIESPVTREEISTFTAFAVENDCFFYLVVPSTVETTAQDILQNLETRNPRKTFVLCVDL